MHIHDTCIMYNTHVNRDALKCIGRAQPGAHTARHDAMVEQSRKDLEAVCGGRAVFESYDGRSAGVNPPSPRANGP